MFVALFGVSCSSGDFTQRCGVNCVILAYHAVDVSHTFFYVWIQPLSGSTSLGPHLPPKLLALVVMDTSFTNLARAREGAKNIF